MDSNGASDRIFNIRLVGHRKRSGDFIVLEIRASTKSTPAFDKRSSVGKTNGFTNPISIYFMSYPSNKYPDDWPLKAYNNPEFLHSAEARTIRVNCELLEPKYRFQKYEIENTIVFFGSARTKDPESSKEHLRKLESELRDQNSLTDEENKQLKKAKTAVNQSAYYADCRELASRMARWAETLGDGKSLHVCLGGDLESWKHPTGGRTMKVPHQLGSKFRCLLNNSVRQH